MQLQPLSRLQHLKALELAFEGRRQQLNGFPDVIAGLMKLESLHFKGAGNCQLRMQAPHCSRTIQFMKDACLCCQKLTEECQVCTLLL